MKEIELNKELFYVNDDEFPLHIHPAYSTLKLHPQFGIFEREIGLLQDILTNYQNGIFINIGISHGGYVPIKIMPYTNDIYVVGNNNNHLAHLSKNGEIYDKSSKIKIVNDLDTIKTSTENKLQIIRFDSIEATNAFNLNTNKSIILTYINLNIQNHKQYNLTKSNLVIYVSNDLIESFESAFKYYLEQSPNLNYNNLINICIMVKNAGDGFKEILEQNLPHIDQWTVLDTGSTDNTIATIKEVFKNKKGNLYQEPFINFRESRNRCLELAGQSCKYTIMLDDTYVFKGNVREFLELIRSDQFADSYNIFINSGDNVYGSNRILKADRKLKYIYQIHEIIQDKNNLVVQLPLDQIYIDDIMNEYMRERSHSRKQSDLTLLFNTLKEYPDVPRTLYYIARTYIELQMWEEVFKYAQERIKHPVKGYEEEITECLLICGNIAETEFKWPWSKCEEIYLECYNHDQSRADALYCIGMHFMKNGAQKAYEYLKKGFELGTSKTATSNLRVNIYDTMLPYHLTPLCYQLKDYKLGERAAAKYLKNNEDKTITSYYKIFQMLNKNDIISLRRASQSAESERSELSEAKFFRSAAEKNDEREILCFVADGGFKPWSGSSINKEGVGGSETFIIEMSRHLANITNYDVYVFCNTPEEEVFENVKYKKLSDYFKFLNSRKVKISIISRYSEYIPVTLDNDVKQVYMVVHDLSTSGNIIPTDSRIKILCMTEWHKQYFLNVFPTMKDKTKVFPNGINVKNYPLNITKKRHSFIYSSFPNRGLIHLLKMFPEIRRRIPDAILNVFCDTKNSWARSVANEDMDRIEKLLEEQKEYVTNHGWVKKDILTKYLLESEVWIYPCTFTETFCVTALEVAASHTLAVSNDPGALMEVVGDRGIIVPGDPGTSEWQEKAINEIVNILNDDTKKNELLKKNREWAEKYDWVDLADIFIDTYIGKGKPMIDYAGMYNWTNDLPPGNQQIFEKILDRFKNKAANILEIGAYAGTSLISMLRYLPDARGTALDLWEDYDEGKLLQSIKKNKVEEIFLKNLVISNMVDRVTVMKGDSKDILIDLLKNGIRYDFIYVDGSHKCLDCYSDMILSWELLNSGGILAVDDYLWKPENDNSELNKPYYAVKHFMERYKNKYNVVDIGYRVFLQKFL